MTVSQLIALLQLQPQNHVVDVRITTETGDFDLEITGLASVDVNNTPGEIPGWVTLEAESLLMTG